MNKSLQQLIFAGFFCAIILIIIGTFSYESGKKKGQILGEKKGVENTKLMVEATFHGASLLLVDRGMADTNVKSLIPCHLIIKGLDTLKHTSSIKTQISFLSDTLGTVIIDRICEFSGIKKREQKLIMKNFYNSKSILADTVLAAYQRKIKYNEDKKYDLRNTAEKARSYSKGFSSGLCFVIDAFTPQQKIKIAKRILEVGTERMRNKFAEEIGLIATDAASIYISDILCQILIENSYEFVIELLMEYATIVNFTEEYLISKQNMESVLKLVTTEITTDVTRTRTFERNWAIDANYTINANSKVIAGIDLKKYFMVEFLRKEISRQNKTQIIVTLPEPEIVSVYSHIYPNSDNKIFATNLNASEIRELYDDVESWSRSDALGKGILESAKKSAEDAFKMLYAPLILNGGDEYSLQVKFTNQINRDSPKVILN